MAELVIRVQWGDGRITEVVADKALAMLEIDQNGLVASLNPRTGHIASLVKDGKNSISHNFPPLP